jgi:acyl carrier protein
MPVADISPSALIDLLTEQEIVDTTDPLTPESDLFACGLDSLAMMQLLLHLEQRFKVHVALTDMTRERFATATALAAFLSCQTRANA